MSGLGPEEKAWFLALIEDLERTWEMIRLIAQRHRALLEVLRAKGTITPAEYKAAIKEREAAAAVDDALDAEEQERRRRVEHLKRLLREE